MSLISSDGVLFELKISLGELASAIAVVGTGYWVARIIERRQASERAVNQLMGLQCRECA